MFILTKPEASKKFHSHTNQNPFIKFNDQNRVKNNTVPSLHLLLLIHPIFYSFQTKWLNSKTNTLRLPTIPISPSQSHNYTKNTKTHPPI